MECGRGEGVYDQREAETKSFICEVRKTRGLHRATHVRDEPQSFSEWNVRVVVCLSVSLFACLSVCLSDTPI